MKNPSESVWLSVKRRFEKAFGVISWMVFILIILFQGNGVLAQAPPEGYKMGYRPITPEELEQMKKLDYFHVSDYIAPSSKSLTKWPTKTIRTSSAERTYSYPASVDLSLTGYLPPVKDQGMLNSCATFSAIYYYKTYQECREHDWDPSLESHQMSPAFIYNYINKGYDGGSSGNAPIIAACRIGCATWDKMPYDGGTCTAFPTEDAWRNATLYRAKSITYLDQSDRDLAIENIKQNLANGDPVLSGGIVSSGFMSYAGGDGEGYNNDVIYEMTDNVGSHGYLIIGYDDNRTYFDGTETRQGAFKIVNSWGGFWGLSGFAWIAYDMIRMQTVLSAYIMEDRIDYQPALLGNIRIEHPNVYTLSLCWGVGDTESPDWAECFLNSIGSKPSMWMPNLDNSFGGGPDNHPLDGVEGIVVDLTDGYTLGMPLDDWFAWIMDDDSSTTIGRITYMALETTTQTLVSSRTPMATHPSLSEGRPALENPVGFSEGISFSPDGTLYVAERLSYRVRKIKNSMIYDLAGSGALGYAGDNGPALQAKLNIPSDVAVDGEGNVFISDTGNQCIRKVDTDGTITTILSDLQFPKGIDVDTTGSLYITDYDGNKVLRHDPDGSVHVIAGTGEAGFSGDEGLATEAQLLTPSDVIYNPVDQNVYISDFGNERIRCIDNQGIIHTVFHPDNEVPDRVAQQLASDKNGAIYFPAELNVSDPLNSSSYLYSIPLRGSPVIVFDYTDILTMCLGNAGIAVDDVGNVYLSQSQGGGNIWIEKVDTSGGRSVFAGMGLPGYNMPVIVRLGEATVELPNAVDMNHWILWE